MIDIKEHIVMIMAVIIVAVVCGVVLGEINYTNKIAETQRQCDIAYYSSGKWDKCKDMSSKIDMTYTCLDNSCWLEYSKEG